MSDRRTGATTSGSDADSETIVPVPLADPQAPTTGEESERGVLDVRIKAIESMAVHASSGVPGTIKVDSVMQRLRRNALPSATVTLRGGRAWIDLQVAASWPCRAERLADNVRRQVFTEASELSSVPIERLDVTLHVLDPSETVRAR